MNQDMQSTEINKIQKIGKGIKEICKEQTDKILASSLDKQVDSIPKKKQRRGQQS